MFEKTDAGQYSTAFFTGILYRDHEDGGLIIRHGRHLAGYYVAENDKDDFLQRLRFSGWIIVPLMYLALIILISAARLLGPVDKLDSQKRSDVIQDSFCGGYLGALADERCGMGIF